MISDSEVLEIRTRLEKSERPIFLYDDDPDGVCSFLLLYKYINKGQGIIVKSSPEVTADKFLEKVKRCDPDLVVILDKPQVELEFIEGIPTDIIWIDHHEPATNLPKKVSYYNPMKNNQQQTSTTAQAWKISQRPEDIWIAAVGTIADWTYVPKIMQAVRKTYPDLAQSKFKTAPDVLFNTQIGTLAKIIYFNLKGATGDVYKSIKVLSRIKDPREILNQTNPQGKFIYQKYKKLNKEYDKLKKKAEKAIDDSEFLISIEEHLKHSFSSELSNEILYRYPKKINIIGRRSEGKIKCSIRTQYQIHLPTIIHEALEGLDGYGGGHAQACGLCIREDQFETFLEIFKTKCTEAIHLLRIAK